MKRFTAFFLSILTLLFGLMPAIQAAAATPTNLISNPSVETSSNGTSPDSWLQGGWGTNTPTFSYLNTGHTGSRSLQVQMNNYTSGDAKWYFAPVAVTAGSTYNFSDYYEATVPTDVVVQLDNGSGTYNYIDLGTVAASSSWAQVNDSFTVPAGFTEASVFHLISSNGTLTTDDFSLSTSINLAVQVTAPTNSSTVSGKSVTLSANASSADGITSVQFKVDGTTVGSPVASAPYTTTWDSTTVSNGTHTVTATALDSSGQTLTSSTVTVTVSNGVTTTNTNLIANPSVETPNSSNSSLPSSWQTGGWGTNTTTYSYVSGSAQNGTRSLQVQTTAYTSGDAKWYFNPVTVTAGTKYQYSDMYKSTIATDVMAQFQDTSGNISYLDLGSAPSSSTWRRYLSTFTVPTGVVKTTIFHLIAGVGTLQTDTFALLGVSTPTVTMSAPAGGTVSGNAVALSANATDSSGIRSVQFAVDGVNVGSLITKAPFTMNWDSTTVANGTHTITAAATNNQGYSSTSAAVTVNVSNTVSGNMILNPSAETPNPSNTSMPLDWQNNAWGTNKPSFTYLNNASQAHSGTRALKISMTNYTSGDAKWYANPVKVTPDTQYQFSDYYQSTVNTEVDVAFDMSDGSIIYQIIGLPEASPNAWAHFTTTFTVPSGAVDMTVFHVIHNNGSLTIDDQSLQTYTPVGFNRALVTLTFDDSYASIYNQGLPVLQKYGFKSTQFIITDTIGTTGYMTVQQLLNLKAGGHEIASHTVTHSDMLTESPTQYQNELQGSQKQLQTWIGSPVTDLAFPNGLYDNTITTMTKQYYTGSRGVEDGLNSKDNLNAYDLKVQNVYNTTTTAQVADWVAQAQATHTWLILVYHAVDADTSSPIDGGIYNVTPTQLDSQLSAIKSSGVAVETMAQALAETQAQE